MAAAGNGHLEAVILLVDRGADINAKTHVSTCECTWSVLHSKLCVCILYFRLIAFSIIIEFNFIIL